MSGPARDYRKNEGAWTEGWLSFLGICLDLLGLEEAQSSSVVIEPLHDFEGLRNGRAILRELEIITHYEVDLVSPAKRDNDP